MKLTGQPILRVRTAHDLDPADVAELLAAYVWPQTKPSPIQGMMRDLLSKSDALDAIRNSLAALGRDHARTWQSGLDNDEIAQRRRWAAAMLAMRWPTLHQGRT